MNWQQIETAPKDGTEVLLFFADYNRKVWLGHYEISEHTSHGRSTYKREYWSIGSMFVSGKDPEPSHWMPLPEPPQ